MAKYTAAAVLKLQQKNYGLNIGGYNQGTRDSPRCSTGSMDLDIATGGGIPINKMSLFYGNEGCGKTTNALRCIAKFQYRFPHKTCVYTDTDGGLDLEWADKMGVDTEKLICVYPDYIHEGIDITEQYLLAEDVGLVVFDSLAATISVQEADASAEKDTMGVSPRMGNKFMRKVILALRQASKSQDPDQVQTFILINQLRQKIGVMFGSPDTLPGGRHQIFASSLTMRIYSKPKMDTTINKHVPVFREMSITLDKWRQPITRRNVKYDMAVEQIGDISPGRCFDWKCAKRHMVDLGWLVRGEENKGWMFFGEFYKTQTDGWEALRTTPGALDLFRERVVSTLKQSTSLPATSEELDVGKTL